MKSKGFGWTERTLAVLVVLAVSSGALAQDSSHKRFIGVINAYSPQTSTTGPYEVRNRGQFQREVVINMWSISTRKSARNGLRGDRPANCISGLTLFPSRLLRRVARILSSRHFRFARCPGCMVSSTG